MPRGTLNEFKRAFYACSGDFRRKFRNVSKRMFQKPSERISWSYRVYMGVCEGFMNLPLGFKELQKDFTEYFRSTATASIGVSEEFQGTAMRLVFRKL